MIQEPKTFQMSQDLKLKLKLKAARRDGTRRESRSFGVAQMTQTSGNGPHELVQYHLHRDAVVVFEGLPSIGTTPLPDTRNESHRTMETHRDWGYPVRPVHHRFVIQTLTDPEIESPLAAAEVQVTQVRATIRASNPAA